MAEKFQRKLKLGRVVDRLTSREKLRKFQKIGENVRKCDKNANENI